MSISDWLITLGNHPLGSGRMIMSRALALWGWLENTLFHFLVHAESMEIALRRSWCYVVLLYTVDLLQYWLTQAKSMQ